MNMEAMPRIRFDIESMKASILAHMGVVGSELGKCLDAEIEKAVNEFPWQQRTSDIVHEAIESQLKSYFQYGKGAESIKSVINESITNHLA
jgi:hypothetical protein